LIIEHIAIWAKDIDKLKSFYEKYFGYASFFRFIIKKRDMPNSESENVRNTLMEYITTKADIEPCV
jgi:predicted enzyme related to lactoylglutathione lyase